MIPASELLHTIALLKTEGVGPVIAKNLIAYCGGSQQVYQKPNGMLARVPDVGPRLMAALKSGPDLVAAERELQYCENEGIEVLHFLSPGYPEYLKTIFDAPLLLFKRGGLDINAKPAIAIVGTRKATPHGKKWAERFASRFADLGVNVVSGLAYGIDIHAHRATLEAGGATTAVVAHGLDMVYPAAHKKTAEHIMEKGALVSELFANTQPKAQFFPARNRILSGMSRAVVVIEAADSGGALITAKTGFDQNREIYALPGTVDMPYSIGCNRLIRDNVAKLVTHPDEVLLDMGILELVQTETGLAMREPTAALKSFKTVDVALSADEQRVLNLLAEQPLVIDAIANRTQLSIASLMPTLLALEFKGLVSQAPGRKFIRA